MSCLHFLTAHLEPACLHFACSCLFVCVGVWCVYVCMRACMHACVSACVWGEKRERQMAEQKKEETSDLSPGLLQQLQVLPGGIFQQMSPAPCGSLWSALGWSVTKRRNVKRVICHKKKKCQKDKTLITKTISSQISLFQNGSILF